MENTFYIQACRFHTKEKNKFLIIGYFQNNHSEGNCPMFYLDHDELSYTMEERRLHPLLFWKRGDQLITKKYFLWVPLPEDWKKHRKLKIYHSYPNRKEFLTSISVRQMEKLEQRINKSIDRVEMEEDGFYIEGWYLNPKTTSIFIEDEKKNMLSMEMNPVLRRDVLREYPENTEEEVVGFRAVYQGSVPKKVKIRLVEGDKREEQIVKLQMSPIVKAMSESRALYQKTREHYKKFGLKATIGRIADGISGRTYTGYEEWLNRHQPSKGVLRKQRKEQFPNMPKISIVVPLYQTPERYLREMIESVRAQSYTKWELCLSDGSGENSPIAHILNEYVRKDSRIRVLDNQKQLHISENTNQGLGISTGEYIAFLDHDDLLTPDALYECVKVINQIPETELMYSDEDKVKEEGNEYFMPHFKPDFNLDLLRSTNYFCHLVVVKRTLYEKVGDLRSDFDGAQDFDFVLRCVEKTDQIVHIPKILYHWRACKGSTAESADMKPYIIEAGASAVRAHYERLGIEVEVTSERHAGMYRSKFLLKSEPMVSVIIPNKDHVDDLKKCIQSLEKKNTYANIEYLIVENNSQEEETFAYYKELEQQNPKIRVLYWEGKGFNYPDINNYAVEQAQGEYLLLLNNDTELKSEHGIEELLGQCMRDDVGAVGARLYYEDGTLQHGGVIVGLGGVAGHAFLGLVPGDPGYFGRAEITQDLSAVTAACMMVKRSVYEEIGGLDSRFAVAFNDVDLCMKIRKAGYLIVYDPHAEWMHYESKSRGFEDTEEKVQRFQREVQLFQSRWATFLEKGDPYYNPNLTLDRNDFSLNTTIGQERR